MKQNIYDNHEFFKNYSELRKKNKGFNQYLEEPAIDSLLPDLENLNILDIGCGFGFFSTKAIKKGAKSYIGIDISEKMISEAKLLENERIQFINCPIEDYKYPDEKFDVVISSVCFHYVKDIKFIFLQIAKSLKQSGIFIFSVEHPVCTALLKGWYTEKTKEYWPVDNYFQESERYQKWFVENVVKYHRTIETYANSLIDAGFNIEKILEPCPSQKALEERKDLFDHTRRPPLLIMKGRKNC